MPRYTLGEPRWLPGCLVFVLAFYPTLGLKGLLTCLSVFDLRSISWCTCMCEYSDLMNVTLPCVPHFLQQHRLVSLSFSAEPCPWLDGPSESSDLSVALLHSVRVEGTSKVSA